MIFNKDFVNEITFWLRHRKKLMKRKHVCNLEIRIEETSLWKARTVIKENVKVSKYQNSINMYQLLFFIFKFQIFCRSWFKFLIGNFTVVLIRNVLPDWEPEFLKQLGPHRYFSGNWWNWWTNKSALGIKDLYRKNFFNWVRICKENEKPTTY